MKPERVGRYRNICLYKRGGCMAGKDIVAKVKADLSFLQDFVRREQILGVLLCGSQARGEAGPRSDIDLCIVAPTISDQSSLWRRFVSHLRDSCYDVRIFELLPLFLKAAVIEMGVMVYCEDEPGALRVLLSLSARLAGPKAPAGDDAGRGKWAISSGKAESIAKF
jgi:hypothetical protein